MKHVSRYFEFQTETPNCLQIPGYNFMSNLFFSLSYYQSQEKGMNITNKVFNIIKISSSPKKKKWREYKI